MPRQHYIPSLCVCVCVCACARVLNSRIIAGNKGGLLEAAVEVAGLLIDDAPYPGI